MSERHIDYLTGKPVDPWVQDYLDRREREATEEEEIERIVEAVSRAFREQLRAIMQPPSSKTEGER